MSSWSLAIFTLPSLHCHCEGFRSCYTLPRAAPNQMFVGRGPTGAGPPAHPASFAIARDIPD